jgi:hypothetical protein
MEASAPGRGGKKRAGDKTGLETLVLPSLHVSQAGTTKSFGIKDLMMSVQASSHPYPQKMCRCELSLPLLFQRKTSHAQTARCAHKPLLYC